MGIAKWSCGERSREMIGARAAAGILENRGVSQHSHTASHEGLKQVAFERHQQLQHYSPFQSRSNSAAESQHQPPHPTFAKHKRATTTTTTTTTTTQQAPILPTRSLSTSCPKFTNPKPSRLHPPPPIAIPAVPTHKSPTRHICAPPPPSTPPPSTHTTRTPPPPQAPACKYHTHTYHTAFPRTRQSKVYDSQNTSPTPCDTKPAVTNGRAPPGRRFVPHKRRPSRVAPSHVWNIRARTPFGASRFAITGARNWNEASEKAGGGL